MDPVSPWSVLELLSLGIIANRPDSALTFSDPYKPCRKKRIIFPRNPAARIPSNTLDIPKIHYNGATNCPAKDQRGAVRPDTCDIGATEFGGRAWFDYLPLIMK
jgi:hypothetical protein